MKVFILTSFGKSSTKNGDARYSYELRNNLKNVLGKNIFINVIGPENDLHFLKMLIYQLIILPIKVWRSNGDIYHATSPGEVIAPVIMRKRTIVTLHDVIYITYPGGTKLIKRIYFYFCCFFIKKANLIITSSEYSKKEINEQLGISPNKIKRIYLGIDEKFKQLKQQKNMYTIGYLGAVHARKNVINLIKAFSIVSTNRNHKLVLSSNPNKEITDLIERLKIKNVEFIGNVSEDRIVDFYNSLSLFVFPSVYEGFGFPPLEAMACGCPVICSNETSVAEIVGDAALKTNVRDYRDIAHAIDNLLDDRRTYNKLQKMAILKSREYTWGKTLQQTIRTYESVIKDNL